MAEFPAPSERIVLTYERVLGPSTRTPWPPGTTSPTGHGRQAVALGMA
jgi:hypothetical protein